MGVSGNARKPLFCLRKSDSCIYELSNSRETDRLVVSFTALDPKFWRAPLQGEIKLARTNEPFTPYACIELSGENNLRPDEGTIFD